MSEERIDPIEKQRRLNDAAARYMAGEITVEEYHRLRDLYTPDYRAIAAALARTRQER